jgi:hypothetical protein
MFIVDNSTYSPVCVFGYMRPKELSACLAALAENYGARLTNVTVFVDGPKNDSERAVVSQSVEIASSFLYGRFQSLRIIAAASNKGLGASVIDGVSASLRRSQAIIVLEDDIVPTKNFLEYMNKSLSIYERHSVVGSISGFGCSLDIVDQYDNYFHPRPMSWGWATWADRWEKAVWDLSSEEALTSRRFKKRFNKGGGDLYRMLHSFRKGKIDSWAIRWAYSHYKNGWLSANPFHSLIDNRGYGKVGTHCVGRRPIPFRLDDGVRTKFNLRSDIVLDPQVSRRVNWYSSNLYKMLGRMWSLCRVPEE